MCIRLNYILGNIVINSATSKVKINDIISLYYVTFYNGKAFFHKQNCYYPTDVSTDIRIYLYLYDQYSI